MSVNIRIASEQHYIHLSASGASTLNIAVQFADQASNVFSAYRDRYEFGASAMKAACGNIYDSRDCLIGRISYNGRIWDAKGNPVECDETSPLPQHPALTTRLCSSGDIGLSHR